MYARTWRYVPASFNRAYSIGFIVMAFWIRSEKCPAVTNELYTDENEKGTK